MKRLLLLLLIPTLSYSQITYEDIMSIDTTDSFIRVMIENGYEKVVNQSDDTYIVYSKNLTEDSLSNSFCMYNNVDRIYRLSLNKTSLFDKLGIDDIRENSYDMIVNDIKKNCKYYDIEKTTVNEDEYEYVCYSCMESKYIGKIGFTIKDGWGWIRNFPYY